MSNYRSYPTVDHVSKLFLYTYPDKFLDWLGKVERWFITLRTLKEKQLSFVASKLKFSVSDW